MGDEQIRDRKAALRTRAKALRAAIDTRTRAAAATAVAGFFFDNVACGAADIVAAYWPIASEFDCKPLLAQLLMGGQTVCLPATEGDLPLTMRLWHEDWPLQASGFGTMAPTQDAPVVVPDLLLLPLLGFDGKGTRLGYGKGHYDRTIALLHKPPRLIGLAFAAQEMTLIPREDHDVQLDAVITEQGFRRFGQTA